MRTALSALVVFLISNVGNTVYYALTADWNHLFFTRDEPIIGLFVLHHLLVAALYVGLWPRFRRSDTLAESAAFGTVLGTAVFLPGALVVRAAWEVPINSAFLANSTFAIVLGVALGVLVRVTGPRPDGRAAA